MVVNAASSIGPGMASSDEALHQVCPSAGANVVVDTLWAMAKTGTQTCRFMADIGVDVIGLVDVADLIFDEEMQRVHASESSEEREGREQELTF